jgi:hypothetical protein
MYSKYRFISGIQKNQIPSNDYMNLSLWKNSKTTCSGWDDLGNFSLQAKKGRKQRWQDVGIKSHLKMLNRLFLPFTDVATYL